MTANPTFRATLPSRNANASASGPTAVLGSILILSPDTRWVDEIQRPLSSRYALVEAAASIQQAERLLQRCEFDLLVVEAELPDGSGLQWIQALRELGRMQSVIVCAPQADADMAISALRAEVADFWIKPMVLEDVLAGIERCFLRHRAVHDPYTWRRSSSRLSAPAHPGSIILGQCEMVKSVCDVIKRVAATSATVLVQGASGTGKEVAARALHEFSGRTGSFVPLNCGAISPELLESELFGHAKGAFTGAHQSRDGLFTYASGGTLFLDEIAEMPLNMQSKLLRVLDDQRIRPVGGNREIPVDVRIIAATHRDLAAAVHAGSFREDLFYRINVMTIHMPRLCERPEDIPTLAEHFMRILADDLSVPPVPITDADIAALRAHAWPGNVREFRNVIERALLLGQSPAACLQTHAAAQVQTADPAMAGTSAGGTAASAAVPGEPVTLAELEKQHILRMLAHCTGNKSEAARQLGISRKTLDRKLHTWEAA